MTYSLNWSLIGPPADVPGSIAQGYRYGTALRQQRDQEQRTDQFQQAAFNAYDPATGNVNAPAMRSAFAGAGNIEGAMAFDAQRAQQQTAQQQAGREQLTMVARLLDEATDQASYDRGRQVAQSMGLDVAGIPPQFDPAWVAQQRDIVREFVQREGQPTSFQRDLQGAGIDPGSSEGRQLLRNRYASPPRIMMVNGVPTLVSEGGAGEPPPVLTDDDVLRLEQGGPGSPAPANFPG